MKIYIVAHENITFPEAYQKVEIMKEDIDNYILKSVSYDNMFDKIPDLISFAPDAVEEHLSEIINFWLENQKDAFYEIGYYDLGDFYFFWNTPLPGSGDYFVKSPNNKRDQVDGSKVNFKHEISRVPMLNRQAKKP